jgi:hypothetical protein
MIKAMWRRKQSTNSIAMKPGSDSQVFAIGWCNDAKVRLFDIRAVSTLNHHLNFFITVCFIEFCDSMKTFFLSGPVIEIIMDRTYRLILFGCLFPNRI